MLPYNYKCFNCQSRFPAEEIEKKHLCLCPKCKDVKKNSPLNGVLLIEYPYENLRKIYHRSDFLKYPSGQFWHYPELWPLQREPNNGTPFHHIDSETLHSVTLPAKKIRVYNIDAQHVLMMDETINPTYSYKDRASILVALKAKQFGITEIAAASTGNAGSSLAGICARLGLKARLWLPASIPEEKLLQIMAYGAQVHLVKGDYDLAFDLCLEYSQKMNWYNRNTAYNPLTIEGKKWGAYDVFLELKGEIPDYIVVPVGDGVILAGLYKGFWELQQLGMIQDIPKLIAVQSSRSDAVGRYLRTGKFEYRPANSVADSISAGAPRNLHMAAHAIKQSNGFAVIVEDKFILEAQQKIGQEFGVLVEPAAAAGLAGYLQIKTELNHAQNPSVLIMLTGSGLKDMKTLKQIYQKPVALSEDEWKEYFERS